MAAHVPRMEISSQYLLQACGPEPILDCQEKRSSKIQPRTQQTNAHSIVIVTLQATIVPTYADKKNLRF